MDALERHPKGWGEELWIANTAAYCGKKLILKKGKQCSVHYHKLKDETFFVQGGVVQMDTYPHGHPGKLVRTIMKPGDAVHVAPLVPHQFTGIEDSEIFEFSTQHFEDDTYRIAPGDSQR
jgi:mannose-6-phosphate isomerase-like protein (cupin superfamily)